MKLYNPRPGGSGNATVPGDAPIQPPQGWVGAMRILNELPNTSVLNFASLGITSISSFTWLLNYGQINDTTGPLQPTFAGNLFGTATTDAILAFFADPANGFLTAPGLTLDVSNQTPPAPPTQDAPRLSGGGSATNNGDYTRRGTLHGKPFYNLVGQPDDPTKSAIAYTDSGIDSVWQIFDLDGVLVYQSGTTSLPAVQATYSVASVPATPVPTIVGYANSDVQSLTDAGCTVTED